MRVLQRGYVWLRYNAGRCDDCPTPPMGDGVRAALDLRPALALGPAPFPPPCSSCCRSDTLSAPVPAKDPPPTLPRLPFPEGGLPRPSPLFRRTLCRRRPPLADTDVASSAATSGSPPACARAPLRAPLCEAARRLEAAAIAAAAAAAAASSPFRPDLLSGAVRAPSRASCSST